MQQLFICLHTFRRFVITCTHTGCARWRTAQWAHVSWRMFSSTACRSGVKKTNNKLMLVRLQTSLNDPLRCLNPYLHGEGVSERGNTLQRFVGTAATTSPQWYAGWDKEMVSLPWQLPPNLHQCVPGLAAAAGIHFQPPPHWWEDTSV